MNIVYIYLYYKLRGLFILKCKLLYLKFYFIFLILKEKIIVGESINV